MKKAEAETAIRNLISTWRDSGVNQATSNDALSFSAFWDWLRTNYRPYTEFISTRGARGDAEQWFDQELGRTWMN